jgi:hypothetical protein
MRELLDRKVGVQSTGRVVGIISATGINDLLHRLEVIEKKDKLVGIVSSSAIALVLFLVLLFWFANAGLVMGIDEPEWKTIGLISPGADYGTDNLGSSTINNFRDPSPNAADRPNAPASANNAAAAANNSPNNAGETNGAITQNHEASPVTSNSGKENTNPTPNTDNKGSGADNKATNTGTTNGGGSNDGETGQVGNTGHPEATVLNENGLFKWGNGIGGAGGRRPLKTELKGYNVQLEEKITFEITIDPNGDVIFVKAPFAVHQELVAIGKANIKTWKFSETDPSAGNLKTTVSISFRLK